MCIGNDGNDLEKDRGSRHMTSISNKDTTIITNNNGHYFRLQVFLPKCEVILSKCFWVPKEKRSLAKIVEMGGDLMCIELSMIEENVRKPLVWYMLKEGNFVPFTEALKGKDENYSMKIVNSWEDHEVRINGISFHISEEVISLKTSLAMKGMKWQKVTRVANEASLQFIFLDGEEPLQHKGGFM